jgi:hypothetical protein
MTPRLTEDARALAPEEGGRYYERYRGRMYANAECACGARFLAWLERGETWNQGTRQFEPHGWEIADLSYRSTFNDEPGEGDKPDLSVDDIWNACELVRTLRGVEKGWDRWLR